MLVMGPLQSWTFLILLLAAVATGTYALAQGSAWFRGIVATTPKITVNCDQGHHEHCDHAGICECPCHTAV